MEIDKKLCGALAKWLSKLDSHEVYDVNGLLVDLMFEVDGVTFRPAGDEKPTAGVWTVQTHDGKRTASLPVLSVQQVIEHRGFIGSLEGKDAMWFVTGWDVAVTMAKLAGLGDPSGYVMGRGKKFQLCVEALERAARG